MNKLLFFLTVVFSIYFPTGCRQETEKPAQLKAGIYVPTDELSSLVDGFKEGLTEYGYTAGESIIYIDAGRKISPQGYSAFVDTIIKENVDLVFTATTPATLKIQKSLEGTRIPIVFGLVGTPAKSGFVKNITMPGGDLTGVQIKNPGENGFHWLRNLVPDLKRLYVPVKPDDIAMAISLPILERIASEHQVELVLADFTSEEELFLALEQIPSDVQAVWQLPSPFWAPYLTLFTDVAITHKKPLKVHAFQAVQQGGLVGYGLKADLLGKQSARIAHKVLQGVLPSGIPVELSDLYLSINLKTAKKIELPIPEAILKQADFIIRE